MADEVRMVNVKEEKIKRNDEEFHKHNVRQKEAHRVNLR